MKSQLLLLFCYFSHLSYLLGAENDGTIYYTALQGNLYIPLLPLGANYRHWHPDVVASSRNPVAVTVKVLRNNETVVSEWRGSADQVNATFPCGVVHTAGEYAVESVYQLGVGDDKKWLTDRRKLRVQWPPMTVQAPAELVNYRNAFQVKVQWIYLKCYPPAEANLTVTAQLVHCGRRKKDEKCSAPLVRATQPVPDVWQVAGLIKDVLFDCLSLDHPGFYRVVIRSSKSDLIIGSSDPIHVRLNPDFQLQTRAKFVRPCGRELAIFYRRPQCLNGRGADRLRLYARRYTNGTLITDYMGEKLLEPVKSVVAVACRLLEQTPSFDALCFRYINTAADGVSIEMIQTCIPSDKTSVYEPGWSSWSNYSECTASYCQPGVRYRYRYCDQPPPQYQGSFCSGHPVEWENCESSQLCNNNTTSAVVNKEKDIPSYSDDSQKENLTSYCQCGCVLQLDNGFTFSLVISMALCPEHRITWQFSVTKYSLIRLQLDYLRMDCGLQGDDVLMVRDGVSSYSPLIGSFNGQMKERKFSQMVASSSKLTLEINTMMEDDCVAGFIATIQPVNELELSSVTALKSKWLSEMLPPPVLTLTSLLMMVMGVALMLTLLYARCRRTNKEDEISSINRSEGSAYQLLSTTMVTSLSQSSLRHDLSDTPADNKKFDNSSRSMTRLQQRSLPNTPFMSTKAADLNRSSTMSPKSFRRQMTPLHHWANNRTIIKGEAIELKLMKRSLTDSLKTLKEEKVLNTTAAGFVLVEDDESSITTANNTLTTVSCSTLFDHQDQDFELDYYDLDVRNAGRDVPDSFLRCVSSAEDVSWDDDVIASRDLYQSNATVDQVDVEIRNPLL